MDDDGAEWVCSLMSEHPSDCRFNILVSTQDEEYGEIELEEGDDSEWTALMEKQIIDAYLAGDAIYFELATDWGMSEQAVGKLIRRETSQEQREEAIGKRRRNVLVRKQAEFDWKAGERDRLAKVRP